MRGRRSPVEPICLIIVPATRVRVTECFPAGSPLILPPQRSLTSENLRDQSKYLQEHSPRSAYPGKGRLGVHQLVLLSYVTTQDAQISNEKNRSNLPATLNEHYKKITAGPIFA